MNKQEMLAILHQDFVAFVEQCFDDLEGVEYQHNWHIEAICHELKQALDGHEPKLVINLPPRYLKSLIVSVAFPAWVLGHDPEKRIICVSYGDDLAKKFMRDFKRIVESEWYQELFPNMRIGSKNTETEIVTTANGGRISTSIGGTLTGKGGDIIIVDDPLKADEAHSDIKRTNVNEWFDTTLFTRLNDKKRGICIVVMQRLHQNDLSGHLIEKEGYRHLVIPAIAGEDEVYQLGQKSFYGRIAGEPLHEAREDIDTLNEIRANIGSLNFSSQYQQSPVPAQGRMFKREWIRYWDTVDRRGGIEFWSWDTAITAENHSDYSVGTHWLVKNEGCFLIDLVRERLEFNALRAKILECTRKTNCGTVLIERSPCSLGVAQSLNGYGLNLISIPVKDGKQARAMRHVAAFEAGRVYFKRNAVWIPDLLNELLAFPASKHDDQVDSITQAITWADHKLLINVPTIHGRITAIGKGMPIRSITF